jgi:hypothetical protein
VVLADEETNVAYFSQARGTVWGYIEYARERGFYLHVFTVTATAPKLNEQDVPPVVRILTLVSDPNSIISAYPLRLNLERLVSELNGYGLNCLLQSGFYPTETAVQLLQETEVLDLYT